MGGQVAEGEGVQEFGDPNLAIALRQLFHNPCACRRPGQESKLGAIGAQIGIVQLLGWNTVAQELLQKVKGVGGVVDQSLRTLAEAMPVVPGPHHVDHPFHLFCGKPSVFCHLSEQVTNLRFLEAAERG